MHFVYILKCSDDSYYTGITSTLALRVAQHQAGIDGGYTSSRRPISLVWSQEIESEHQAFELERKLKGWSRAKKEALIAGDFDVLHGIVKRERQRRENRKRL